MIHHLTIRFNTGPSLTPDAEPQWVANKWRIVGEFTAPRLAAWLLAQLPARLAWNITAQVKFLAAKLLAWPVDYFTLGWDGLLAEGIVGVGNKLEWTVNWKGLPIVVSVERFEVSTLEGP